MQQESLRISRRAALGAAVLTAVSLREASAAGPATQMGIATTSFALPGSGAAAAGTGAPGRGPVRRDTIQFLERCAALGAGGIQSNLSGDLARLRTRADELGMWIEGMIGIPRDGNIEPFQTGLRNAKAAGATVMRAAALSGRRYETFTTVAAWSDWKDNTFNSLEKVVPVLEREKVYLALENHKDWTLEDHLAILKRFSSEYLGACLDFGNNIAMLDDPMEMAEQLAPYTLSTHVKDMGVSPYDDGFLLSEVPLGEGYLDLKRIVDLVRKARPKTRFSLEMMTRDPLKVPCLTDRYWEVFPNRGGRYLARTLSAVRRHTQTLPVVSGLPREELARLEEENVKKCLRYSRESLSL